MLSKKNRANILVVDDSRLNIERLNSILIDKYNVDFALSGEKALEIIVDNRPDLILLDIVMTGISGYEVCAILKSNALTRDIPIIFVSSRGFAIDEVRAFELGAVDYITKPVSAPVVNARVKAHLSYYYHQVELEEKVELKTKEIYDTRLEIISKLSIA
ncbi:MAG: response regulator, partial [Acidaminobacteraceae bacterium]